MSGLLADWRMSERILLAAVIAGVVLAVARWAMPAQQVEARPAPVVVAAKPAAAPAQGAGSIVALQPSPAGAELLARIRTCSEQDLAYIVDRIAPAEAVVLAGQLTASDRQAVVEAMPAPLLARKAQALLGVPERYFRNAAQPGLLASSLVEIAMGATGTAAGGQRPALRFATAIDAQGIPQAPRGTFRPDERRIWACLDLGPEPTTESGVLVRWSEESSGALVYLRYLPLVADRRWQSMYFAVDRSWNVGAYRVRWYRIGTAVQILAEGSYVVGRGD